ncbi:MULTISPECIES: hypothetical protein [Streptomyces]|uniref:hypothetical protein n=1 Tax=Streptomyces TaxID=1883 RepID=UPI00237E1390|nr:hypothetical protein [Streptomyces sp. G7(2002)]WDT59137.1 hypothetical protein NUT86_36770 [Streptomyces sp. G7(2002)]
MRGPLLDPPRGVADSRFLTLGLGEGMSGKGLAVGAVVAAEDLSDLVGDRPERTPMCGVAELDQERRGGEVRDPLVAPPGGDDASLTGGEVGVPQATSDTAVSIR